MLPVVNYERMERLAPEHDGGIQMNLNTISIFIIIIGALLLYKRYVDINRSRQRWHT
ncbi:hypothetical protein [Dishui Lake phycodnavirus 2]|nr:hypothetical protein [Dishui Lake phycodnavirus 2]